MLALQGDEEQEETDNLVNQVLDEIGINLDEQMVNAPGGKVQVLAPSCFEEVVFLQDYAIARQRRTRRWLSLQEVYCTVVC